MLDLPNPRLHLALDRVADFGGRGPRRLVSQHGFAGDAVVDRVPRPQVANALPRIFARKAVLEEEAQQVVVVAHIGAEQLAARDDRPLLPRERAFERAILEPLDAALERDVPRGGEPFRPGPRAQLVEVAASVATNCRCRSGVIEFRRGCRCR